VEAEDKTTKVLANLLHFFEEETYIFAKSIDNIEGHMLPAKRLKQKRVAFLNQDKAVEAYLKKEKPELVSTLNKAIKGKKQVLLKNYASGNSQTNIQQNKMQIFLCGLLFCFLLSEIDRGK
jgi:elongation factor P hydroxylase